MAMPEDRDYVREQLSKLKQALDEVHNTVHGEGWGAQMENIEDATKTESEFDESDKRQRPSYGDWDSERDEREAAEPGTGSSKHQSAVSDGDDGDEYDAGHISAQAARKKKKAAEDFRRLLGR